MSHLFKSLGILFCILFTSLNADARTRWVEVTSSQPEVAIYANGKFVGKGNAKFLVTKNVDMTVKLELEGFLTETYMFYYRSGMPAEKSKYFEMKVDDSFEASIISEIANIDIGLNTSYSKSEAWERLTQIVLLYFEIPEQMDERAGYLRSAWVTESFQQNVVRTRVIVRTASLEPLSFRVKLVSEVSKKKGAKGTEDDAFKPWNRILRKYEPLITELQARLK